LIRGLFVFDFRIKGGKSKKRNKKGKSNNKKAIILTMLTMTDIINNP
jgi:hypothetical protein